MYSSGVAASWTCGASETRGRRPYAPPAKMKKRSFVGRIVSSVSVGCALWSAGNSAGAFYRIFLPHPRRSTSKGKVDCTTSVSQPHKCEMWLPIIQLGRGRCACARPYARVANMQFALYFHGTLSEGSKLLWIGEVMYPVPCLMRCRPAPTNHFPTTFSFFGII